MTVASPSAGGLERLLERFARALVQPAVSWAVVLATAAFGLVCASLAVDVRQDDDILAFLPDTDPDIRAFRDINARFGSTDIALVGIAAPDPFDGDFMRRLQELTRALDGTVGLDGVLSVTNLTDFVADPETGGIITDELVHALPTSEAEERALRDKVMDRDHVVGRLVSEDADAVLIYAFGAPGAQPRELAGAVREEVLARFPAEDVVWGGGPFISTWIYETTQEDMARLTPWSVVAILVVLLLSFRDVSGTLLGLVATTIGIAASRAAMAALGVEFNIVLGAMPIILFATGSAYAIHMLSDYDRQAKRVGAGPEAVVRTLVDTAPANLVAGLTTMAGLGSLLTMDIAPLRVFGVFTALGVIVAMVVSLTFVPAVMALFPRPVRPERGTVLEPVVEAVARGVRRNRAFVGLLTAALFVLGLLGAEQVSTRMDLRAFFAADTEPEAALDFLDRSFGGSQYVQLLVEGDLEDPAVLRELGRVGDRIEQLEHVTGVDSVEDALALVNDAMVGARRVPDTRGQAAVLYRFLANDRASTRLVEDDHRGALVQVRVGTAEAGVVDAVLARIEALVEEEAAHGYRLTHEPAEVAERFRADVIARLGALAAHHRVTLPAGWEDTARRALLAPAPEPDGQALVEAVRAFLRSEECFVPLDEAEALRVAAAVARLDPDSQPVQLGVALSTSLGARPEDPRVADLAAVLPAPLRDLRRAAVARASAAALGAALGLDPHGRAEARLLTRLASKLEDRGVGVALVPDPGASTRLSWTVSGMPVLYRGLSRSVASNQVSSFASALVTVVVLMSVVYRSLWTGLLMAVPTSMTLVLVYGAMGGLGIGLDIGTSMIAAMILGDSVDYAVHVLHAWQAGPDEPIEEAVVRGVRHGAHSIWTNAAMVAAGFWVLTLGSSRPLQNVGGLVGAAMLVAAATTFVYLPLLGAARRYRRPGRYAA